MTKLEDLIYRSVTKTVPDSLPKNFLYFGAGKFLDHFNVLIDQRGIEVIHTNGVVCPCNQSSNEVGGMGMHLPDCASCGGLGLVFPDETTTRFRALISNLNENESRDSSGSVTGSSINVSVRSGTPIDSGSRLVLPQNPTSIMWNKRYDSANPMYTLPFLLDSVIALGTKGPRASDPFEYLKNGVDYTINREKRQLHVLNANHGMNISGVFSAIPFYIVQSQEKAGRGLMKDLSANSQYIQLPSFFTAVRADILLRTRYQENA